MSFSALSLILIGLLTGGMSGLFGVGGGFLLVPLLSLIGWPMPLAIGTSLFYVFAVSVAGAIAHHRRGNLDPRLVAELGLPAVAGALAGAFGVHLAPVAWLDLAFAAVVAFAGWQLMHGREPEGPAIAASGAANASGAPGAARPTSGGGALGAAASLDAGAVPLPAPAGRAMGLGLAVGLLSGLLGVGGGVLMVPGQTRWLGVPIKRAIGNSLAAVVLTGASGALTHLLLGHLDWRGGLWLIAGGWVGMRGGLWVLERIPHAHLRRWFMGLMYALALVMAYRGLHGLLVPGAR
jgi:hypothetical protein